MKRLLLLAGGLLLLAALAYHRLQIRPPATQDVLACVSAKLGNEKFARIEVAVDGRDVMLSGFAADATTVTNALAAASDECGARVVANRIEVMLREPFLTSMCIDADGAHISGSVASDKIRRQAMQQADRQFHGASLLALAVRKDAPDGHGQLFAAALRALPQLENGCMTIEDTELNVQGEIRLALARARVEQVLDTAANDNFTTSYDLSIPDQSAAAVRCEQLYNEALEPGEHLLFEFDSATLHLAGRELLDSLYDTAGDCAGLDIIVSGHTDWVGDPVYNLELSLRKANAVVDYLLEKGADRDHLTAVGYGDTRPRASNDTATGRAQNRRVEFRVREMPAVLPDTG
ncbi:MAG TPA: OmpA family protein [Woeseiaceae bacterium]|nr:OmpA family protein [Woeseiaceae bacterium]